MYKRFRYSLRAVAGMLSQPQILVFFVTSQSDSLRAVAGRGAPASNNVISQHFICPDFAAASAPVNLSRTPVQRADNVTSSYLLEGRKITFITR